MDPEVKVILSAMATVGVWFVVAMIFNPELATATVADFAVIYWPFAFWLPAIVMLVPQVFVPWSREYRLRQRISRAQHEARMIELRMQAEEAERNARTLMESYLNSEVA